MILFKIYFTLIVFIFTKNSMPYLSYQDYKKIILASFFVIMSFSVFGQSKADATYDKIAKETCACVEKQSAALEGADSRTVQLKVGLCLIEGAQNHEKSLPKEFRGFMNDQAKMRELGTLVGVKMATHCPALIARLSAALQGEESADAGAQATGVSTLHARVESITTQNHLLIFHVIESDGTKHNLLWFDLPEGDEGIVSKPLSLTGKTLSFEYFLLDVYNRETLSYNPQKKIIGVSTE